jgi:hypothetical protein
LASDGNSRCGREADNLPFAHSGRIGTGSGPSAACWKQTFDRQLEVILGRFAIIVLVLQRRTSAPHSKTPIAGPKFTSCSES